MVSRILKVDPFDLVVFGGTGDLAHRKLFPALFRRFLDGQFSAPTRIIGVSRQPLDRAAYQGSIADALRRSAGDAASSETLEAFLDLLDYVALDVGGDEGWPRLKELFDGGDPARVRAFYLATAPDRFGAIAKQLAKHGLVTPASRIIVEKPIGEGQRVGRADQ